MTNTAESVAASRWAGGVCPFEAGWRKVMMWVFIITDGLLFAGFLAGYGFSRLSHTDWPDQSAIFNLSFIAAMTFVLISSSATMASAVRAAETGERKLAQRFLWLTALGGLVFLAMQAKEWSTLIGEGVRLSTNPWGAPLFGSYFFLITGFHGTHVLSGVIILVVTLLRWGRGITKPAGVELAGLYWHFVDLVWVFIFTVFYLL
ncbi:MAG: cytochrome c oxidase subunit 3 [Thermoanaerobaculia bacterium]